MGAGIAGRAASEGLDVTLVDTKPEFLDRALDRIREGLNGSNPQRFGFPEDPEAVLERVHVTTDPAHLSGVKLVIEAVPEDLRIKREALAHASKLCAKQTVFATSIHTASLDRLTERLSGPDRFVGMHFFYHPLRNPLVEVVPSSKTSPATLRRAKNIARMMGGVVIESADQPGFVVKRLFAGQLIEAVQCLGEENANPATVNLAARKALGLGKGPFEMMNERGLGIARQVTEGLEPLGNVMYALPERLRAMEAAGELWNLEDPVVPELVDQLVARFWGLAALIGGAIVDEGIARIEDVDRGARLALGWKEGPFELMNRLGVGEAAELVKAIAELHELDLPAVIAKQTKRTEPFELSFVDLDIADNVATVTINRPDPTTARSDAVVEQIDSIVSRIEKDSSISTVVFTSQGTVLSFGPSPSGLVDEMSAGAIDDVVRRYRKAGALLDRIGGLDRTTVLRTRGITVGGGAELGLACDAIIAGPRSIFAFPESGWGIHSGLGATQRLPRKVGKSIGKYLLLTGEVLTASAAARFGLVDAVGEDEDSLDSLVEDISADRSAAGLSADAEPPRGEEIAAISLFDARHCRLTLDGELDSDDPIMDRVRAALDSKAPAAKILIDKLVEDGLGYDLRKEIGRAHV